MKLEEIDWKEEFMPSYVSLYYVDYRDDLSSNLDLLNNCVQKNNLYPLLENVNDWWDYPEGGYLREIRKKVESFFEENGDEDDLIEEVSADEYYDNHEEEFKEYLWEHDDSDPVKDLLGNTSKITFFYDLGHECEHGWHTAFMCSPWQDKECDEVVKECAEILGILPDTPEAKTLELIVEQSPYGGQLRIYFSADIEDMISGEQYAEDKEDWKTIKFKGEFNVGIYNPCEGSGWVEPIKLDCAFKFNRENLCLSKLDHYSWESCAGTYDNWCNEYDEPSFSYEEGQASEVGKSDNKALREQEEQYIKTYKAGGCTAGDMDITRHRDVYYRNTIPCGNVCPHCGTFWID